MNRRRSRAKAGFPRNLYESKGYYSWRNPMDDSTSGLGRDRARAFADAHELNLHVAKLQGRQSAVERVFGSKQTVQAWETKYQEILKKHSLTPATRANYLAFSRRMVKMLGDKPLKAITALQISEGLDALVNEGLAGVAKSLRNYMQLSFAEAIVQGWRTPGDNPVIDTRISSPPAVVRSRLTLEMFQRVYSLARPWLQSAMALALTSGQRREDVARATFKDFHDGHWWLEQASEKTDHPHRIRIPLDLKPQGFHLSLGEVVSQSKRTGVLSSFVVHQTERRRGRSVLGRAIRLSTVSSAFTACVNALGADWGDKTPPTFHEIRSLSARLYGDQGVNVQVLLGHSRAETTAIYRNSRGQEWSTVATV